MSASYRGDTVADAGVPHQPASSQPGRRTARRSGVWL